MQIHQLNTLRQKPGATDYLAIDTGFDTAKISAEEFLKPLNDGKINQPIENGFPSYGSNGQLLRTNGDGSTSWVDEGLPSDEQTANAVSAWLDDHPEATTTVEDGSLTEQKFSTSLKYKTIKDYVTPEMFGAIGDGVADDTTAVTKALLHDAVCFLHSYKITEAIETNASHIFGNGTIIADNGFLICNNNVVIEGITIENSAGTAILANESCLIRDITINGGQYGINCGTKYTDVVDISNAKIKNLIGAGSCGIQADNGDFTTIRDCYIENIRTTSGQDADGIKFYSQNNVGHLPVLISHCTIHNCDGRHIKDQSVNSVIENCSLYNDDDWTTYIAEFRSIDLQYGGRHIVNNNRIISPRYGIYAQQGTRNANYEIINNFIESTNYYALVVGFNNNTYENIIKIQNNELCVYNGANSCRLYGGALSTYRIESNIFNNSGAGYPLRLDNWQTACRLELINNKVVDSVQMFNPGYRVLNLYSDDSPRQLLVNANDITFNDLKNYNDIRFWGKISDITDIADACLIERKGLNVYFSSNSYYRIYNDAGGIIIGGVV